MSRLNVDKITGATGTASGAPITLSGNAATLSGTGVTFPAGHVLQVVQNESTETNTLTTSYVNLYEVSITLKSASSDVYASFSFHHEFRGGGGLGVKIYRNNSATVATSHSAVWTKNLEDGTGPYTWYNGDDSTMYDVGTLNTKDTLSGFSVGNTLYYGFFSRKYDSNAVYLPSDGTSQDGFISSTLMEVQK